MQRLLLQKPLTRRQASCVLQVHSSIGMLLVELHARHILWVEDWTHVAPSHPVEAGLLDGW